MTALARIQLARREPQEVAPRKLRDDQPEREFGDDLAEEAKKPQQAPTAEQLALAGVLVPRVVPPPIQLAPIEIAIAPVEASRLALLPSVAVDMPADSTEKEDVTATPLEQAVIDMLDQAGHGPHDTIPDIVVAKLEIARDLPAPRVTHAAPVAEPRALPQPDAPTSHVNLVLDEGEQRVVVTVAVRGNDVRVNVQLRGGDDNVAASLARNAGSLDEAMRMRGLSLADFTASRDHDAPDRERPQQRERDAQPRERFTLEETR